MNPVLQAKHVRKVFSNRGNIFTALHDIDLTIFEGEFVGIMGPSGSGKSTLLNILSTIDIPTTGEIIVNGEQALVAVNTGLNKQLTGLENIELKGALLGLTKKQIQGSPSAVLCCQGHLVYGHWHWLQ